MTAARALTHKEHPAPGSTQPSLQLWLNIPSTHKMIKPRYQNLRAEKMPVREENGATIRVFSGSSKGVRAPTRNIVPVTMVEMNVEPGCTVSLDLRGQYSGCL